MTLWVLKQMQQQKWWAKGVYNGVDHHKGNLTNCRAKGRLGYGHADIFHILIRPTFPFWGFNSLGVSSFWGCEKGVTVSCKILHFLEVNSANSESGQKVGSIRRLSLLVGKLVAKLWIPWCQEVHCCLSWSAQAHKFEWNKRLHGVTK